MRRQAENLIRRLRSSCVGERRQPASSCPRQGKRRVLGNPGVDRSARVLKPRGVREERESGRDARILSMHTLQGSRRRDCS